jgi:hypothetical protein
LTRVRRPRTIGLLRASCLILLFLGCGGAVSAPNAAPTYGEPEEIVGKDSLSKANEALPQVVAEPAPADFEGRLQRAVAVINDTVPKWSEGAASVVVFNKTGTDTPLMVLLESRRAPQAGKAHYLTYALAEGSAGSSWFVVGVDDFREGPFVCNSRDSKADVLLAIADGRDFKGDDPTTLWSDNKGGSCDGVMKRLPNGDMAIVAQGRLVSNDGNSIFTLRASYTLIRNAPKTPITRRAAGPAAPAKGTIVNTNSQRSGPPRLTLPR